MFKGPLTLGELLENVKSQYGVNLSIISNGKTCIYNSYSNQAEEKAK